MNRRILTLMVALIPIVVFGILLAVVTVPYVSLGPGPAFDTLGEIDGKQVVDIKGTQTHPTTGHLDMISRLLEQEFGKIARRSQAHIPR